MNLLKIVAWTVVFLYCLAVILLYTLQTRLIFYPGILQHDFKFRNNSAADEIFLNTSDGERINALFFRNIRKEVILYFHGNAGDLSGWQFVAEDFDATGYNFFIIDYRGYGKSSGSISEKGLYLDADAAYAYLIRKGFSPENILIYGRSVGSGIAVDLASKKSCKGLVLEAPFSSLGKLANQKLPFFFPSLYLRFRFDNLRKIESVKCPVVFLHGSEDTLIPPSHSSGLFEKLKGKKKLIVVPHGSHNDLHAFKQYSDFVADLNSFF